MPEYRWDDDKNEWLRHNRGLTFADMVYHINHGDLLDDIEHPNQQRDPRQRMYIVRINNRAWAVPHRRTTRSVFLYTAYPSGKFTRIYRDQLGGENERR